MARQLDPAVLAVALQPPGMPCTLGALGSLCLQEQVQFAEHALHGGKLSLGDCKNAVLKVSGMSKDSPPELCTGPHLFRAVLP